MKRFALVLLVMTAAGATAQANATKGWHRCRPFSNYSGPASLCDGQGHVLFPFLFERAGSGGYTQIVTGFRQTSSRRAIVDTHADWGVIEGECGQTGYILDCHDWVAVEQVRYRTSDGGRHRRPVSFHRKVVRYEGPGPDPPVQTGIVDDHPPLQPCNRSHAHRAELVRGLGSRFGNWCAPPDEWKMPDSLKTGAPAGSSHAATGTPARRSVPTVTEKDTRTYIHVKGRGRYSATCGPFLTYPMSCSADWSDPAEELWAVRPNRRRWSVGFAGVTTGHIIADVTRVRPGLWRVEGEGSIRLHSPGRWDVYKHDRMIGYTSGPHGVGAAGMWLVSPA